MTPLLSENGLVENGLVEQAVAFVMRNTGVTADLLHGARREETRAYPDEAVREAIVNAMVHRDYLLSATKNGKTLIFEIKGEEDDQDRAKYQAARRWVTAVNNWGRLGIWDFTVCRDPALIPRQIAQVAAMKK